MDLDPYSLIIFGDFSVLTNAPFKDRQPLHMLPGRVEYLTKLREGRARLGGPELLTAVTGNKGGVAFGLQSEAQATEEIRWTALQIGAVTFEVCFAHPHPAEGYERYAALELLSFRKPKPGMINKIIEQLKVPRERVLVVGTYADDCKMAIAASVTWQTTRDFFGEAEQRYEKPAAPTHELVDEFNPFEDL